MGKNKLKRWTELETFDRVYQPAHGDETAAFKFKGRWKQDVFKNQNPIVLELGCGRGEYTVNMGLRYPMKNFIGIDIKGARLWRGAKTAMENNLSHLAFIRTRIEFLDHFFAPGEVSEIWITFPDPQPRESREKKRLTCQRFLNMYRSILEPRGLLHLKTDSDGLFGYTLGNLKNEKGQLLYCSDDLYHEAILPPDMDIRTTYERMFIAEGKAIRYLRFRFE